MFPILFILGIASYAKGLNVTAKSCSQSDVQSAVNKVQNSGDGVVFIPAGDCTWIRSVIVRGNVSFIGQGSHNTIIRKVGGRSIFEHTSFKNRPGNRWVRYSKIGFHGLSDKTSTLAIDLKDTLNFRIDQCYFYSSRWHGVVTLRRVKMGLIDHNTFVRSDFGTSDYGIQLGSNYLHKPSTCDYNDANCRSKWDAWWDDPNSNNGMTFNENFPAGTGDAIYVEDNVFDWKGSTIQGNWGSNQAIVFRHNTVRNRDGNNGGIKPGAQWFEIYNNTFENIAPSSKENPFAAAIYLRSSGLFYNNTIINYARGGQFAAWYCGFGFCYTDQVLMDKTYVYNNIYINCTCPGDNSNCWTKWSEGAPDRITENKNYFFRAPQPSDRIYPYTPYTYPHPLASIDDTL